MSKGCSARARSQNLVFKLWRFIAYENRREVLLQPVQRSVTIADDCALRIEDKRIIMLRPNRKEAKEIHLQKIFYILDFDKLLSGLPKTYG